MLTFTDPNREDIFNWGRDLPLAQVAHIGQLPIQQDTELLDNPLGGFIPHVYKVYADCTVYIDVSGYLAIEFYREGNGTYPGNPENGEHVTVYWMQCASVGDARVVARNALLDTDGILSADYFLGQGFEQEIL